MSNLILALVVFICILLAYVSYLLWLHRTLRSEAKDFEDMANKYSKSLEHMELLLHKKGFECVFHKNGKCTLASKGDDA